MEKERPKCVNDIWEGRIPTCRAGYLSCNPDVCEFYHPVDIQKPSQIRTVEQLLSLLEKYRLEVCIHKAEHSPNYILSFSKRGNRDTICNVVIPTETVKDIENANSFIERGIWEAVKFVGEKEPDENG